MAEPRRIILTIDEPVTAELRLVTDTQSRPPTDEELLQIGYVSKNWLYSRMKQLLQSIDVFIDDIEDDNESALRYFLEYLAVYHHDISDDQFYGMKEVIRRAKTFGEIMEPEI